MKVRDRRLAREIFVVLALKLALLALLWQFFVRDQRVEVDAAALARRIAPAPSPAANAVSPPSSARHDQ